MDTLFTRATPGTPANVKIKSEQVNILSNVFIRTVSILNCKKLSSQISSPLRQVTFSTSMPIEKCLLILLTKFTERNALVSYISVVCVAFMVQRFQKLIHLHSFIDYTKISPQSLQQIQTGTNKFEFKV